MSARVLVTRSVEDAEPLATLLRACGLEVVCVPLLARVFLATGVESLSRCEHFDWLVLTSRSTVEAWCRAGRPRSAARVAAVGAATARAARVRGLNVDAVPPRATGEDLVRMLAPLHGQRVLYPHAAVVEPTTAAGLRQAGAVVTEIAVYENVTPPDAGAQLRRAGPIDVVTLTSGSAARRYAALANPLPSPSPRVVTIGPSTTRAARSAGLEVAAVAREASTRGLAEAVCALLGSEFPGELRPK